MPWLIGWLVAEMLDAYEDTTVVRWSARVFVVSTAFVLLALLDEAGLSLPVVIAIVLAYNEIGKSKWT